MALGISLEEAVRRFGHSRATTTRMLAKVLREGGLRCPDRVTRFSRDLPLPARCIVKLRLPGRSLGHWVLHWDWHFHDPADGHGAGPGWRITSYLPIEGPNAVDGEAGARAARR